MPPLPNPKHELFAQALADGKSQFEAHGLAGYRAHRSNASALAQSDNIVARVTEILGEREKRAAQSTAKAIERTALTKEWIIERLVENAKLATAAEDYAPANRALELLGKEMGMFIDRKEIRTGPLGDKSEDELDAIIRRAAAEAQVSVGPSGKGPPTQH